MQVSGPNSVWRLRNNFINAENTVHELSHERVSNSKKTRYRKLESHSERHFKWSRKLRYQRPFSNNSIKKTSVTYGKSTLIPQPYAHFRLRPLYSPLKFWLCPSIQNRRVCLSVCLSVRLFLLGNFAWASPFFNSTTFEVMRRELRE